MEIVLVDGVGRCAIQQIPDAAPPPTFTLARAYVPSGPDRIVVFVRTTEDASEADGRTIYRQRGLYHAPVRWIWLRKSPIVPFNPPQVT